MKSIKNISTLENELLTENPNWKQIVFDKTGVWVNITGDTQGDWELVSAACCPYGAKYLDEDVCEGSTENSIEIHSVDDLVEYIGKMETYQNFLKDVSFGAFTKAELFWAIEAKILAENMDSVGRIYGLSGIYGPGEPCFSDMQPGDLWLDFAACAFDEIPGIYLKKEYQISLDEAVANIAGQLKEFRDNQEWTPDEVPLFKYNASAEFHVPTTTEELIEAYNEQKA